MKRNVGGPPRFILSAFNVLDIPPETLRLAKRGQLKPEEPQALCRLLRCSSTSQIAAILNSLGFPGRWDASCQSKLSAIAWTMIYLNYWTGKVASDIDYRSFIHLSVPLRCQYFPLYTLPSRSVSNSPRSHNHAVMIYGRIMHKLRHLHNLETSRLRLLRSIQIKVAANTDKLGTKQLATILSLLSHKQQPKEVLFAERQYCESLQTTMTEKQEDEASFLQWVADSLPDHDKEHNYHKYDVSPGAIKHLQTAIHSSSLVLFRLEQEAVRLFFQIQLSDTDMQHVVTSAHQRLESVLTSEQPLDTANRAPDGSIPIHEYYRKLWEHEVTEGEPGVLLRLIHQHRPHNAQSVAQALTSVRKFHSDVLKKAENAAVKQSPYDIIHRCSNR